MSINLEEMQKIILSIINKRPLLMIIVKQLFIMGYNHKKAHQVRYQLIFLIAIQALASMMIVNDDFDVYNL